MQNMYHRHLCYHHYAGYLQLHISNKPCFYGTHSYSCSVFTVCATCNVILPVKYVLYLYISTSHSLCAVPNTAVFLQFHHHHVDFYVYV